MKKISSALSFGIPLLLCSTLMAKPYRIYCHPGGVNLEYRIDEQYTAENVNFSGLQWFTIDHAAIPAHEFIEQLRCQGTQLVADAAVVPEWAARQREATATAAELDAALAEPDPDVVNVLRLQRTLEKLRAPQTP